MSLKRCTRGWKKTGGSVSQKMNHNNDYNDKSLEKSNYLMYMDNIKLLGKNKNKNWKLILEERIYSQVIWMEFGIENNKKINKLTV